MRDRLIYVSEKESSTRYCDHVTQPKVFPYIRRRWPSLSHLFRYIKLNSLYLNTFINA